MFATPPWKGQRRLAIVVAAETLPFMIDGSFRVQGRNCALDVWREGKKFRVICSLSSPSSVLHAYAKDLSDLRTLLNSRCAESEVHICVDAQTGLGTWPTRPFSENIGTTTVSHHSRLRSRTFDSPATNSDHWGLTATIKSPFAKVPQKKKKRETHWLAMSGQNQIQQVCESECEHESVQFGSGAMRH